MPVTMKDIAVMANVSQAAVSLALNNKQSTRVSDKKRREILDLAREHGYTPSVSARHLRGKGTNVIGIVAEIYDTPMHRGLIFGITSLLRKKGYHSMLVEPGHGLREDVEIIRQLAAHGVEAIVNLSQNKLTSIPAIPFLQIETGDSSDIGIDKEYGGYAITRHLIHEHGHEKIAFLTFVAAGSKMRHRGYLRALDEIDVIPGPELFICIRNNFEAEKNVLDLISSGKATAFFCSNDYLAAQLISFLQRNGIKIPDDVAVIGFDGLKLTELFIPAITTVIQPMSELAEASIELLIRKLANNSIPIKRKLVKPILRLAESCGCEKSEPPLFADFRSYEGIEACEKLIKEERKNDEQKDLHSY